MGEKILCLFAYIFTLPGALFVRLAGRKNNFCLHHARRSLELSLFMLGLLLAWYVVKAILLLIPYVGFPLSMMLFGIIVAAGAFSLVLCIIGIAKAFRKKTVVFPFITSIMSRIEPLFNFIGLPGV